MSGRVLLYGATGYSGSEIASHLSSQIDVVVGGRDAKMLGRQAERLGIDYRVFSPDDHRATHAALEDIEVLLNAAGPYLDTAMPLVDACLRTQTHYLDIGGEWPVFDALAKLDDAAQQAGIMLMPGVGLTIAASDCLLARAVELWPGTQRIHLGISRAHAMSQGSARSAARLFERAVLVREGGDLRAVPLGGAPRSFDFGLGLRDAIAMSWADVITGERTTGVSNIAVYSELPWWHRAAYRASGLYAGVTGAETWRRGGGLLAGAWPENPPSETRREGGYVFVIDALDRWRRSRSLRLRTLDGYGTTVLTASHAAERVVAGEVATGFQTPAGLFGSQFIESCQAGVFEPVTGVHAA